MIAGKTLIRNIPSCEICVFVKKATPSLAKLNKLSANPDIKWKISYPTPVLSTNSAMMNCISMPTRTVCHLTCARCLLVAQSTPINTSMPNIDTARLSRVLLSDSGEAKAPTRYTAMTSTADSGVRSLDGMSETKRTAVCFQRVCTGLKKRLTGRYRVRMRRAMHSQKRKGTTQFLSARWSTSDAIHHLYNRGSILGLLFLFSPAKKV